MNRQPGPHGLDHKQRVALRLPVEELRGLWADLHAGDPRGQGPGGGLVQRRQLDLGHLSVKAQRLERGQPADGPPRSPPAGRRRRPAAALRGRSAAGNAAIPGYPGRTTAGRQSSAGAAGSVPRMARDSASKRRWRCQASVSGSRAGAGPAAGPVPPAAAAPLLPARHLPGAPADGRAARR